MESNSIKRNIVIAIDGPAGAGKSTISKALAKKLGLSYLDTGAMYRAIALLAMRGGYGPLDGTSVAELAKKCLIFFGAGEPQRVILDDEDITDLIRSPEVAQLASELSTHPSVRKVLVERQQQIVQLGGVILEGRDVTTVVAPNADIKIYLTASLEERAKRRLVEYETKGIQSEFVKVRTDIEERDHRDITRDESPLSVAKGAVVIDSANRSIDEVISMIEMLVRSL